ncbi:sulfurtransferase complex subunit TusB [Brenneria goodwinii]|uniref:Protein TusB n=1 Tax=Brenneria goodwinii TaxID=1109412 RepID=A0A0G4JUM4_9GAMM|nr:sulfurtransferase complex subunit TusB [Brenneria goodwinii]MCG8158206.1 sulfurtransferase complex subunit TusB [Brenneria goodwinii]MCG8162618.1 sulfurtransferase complex subunit TusB [Brenneria goodwinii]MCG8167256.1 sulfurtransferase complex subunit TusB [Brenneria goodwinii]MCG8171908.1 sulfurtransferase complex subunit TusB [Brenneria goodwinii]MCG8176640.1 sulfurtransferase complex subunit TusB [Brenneria goodwinii]
MLHTLSRSPYHSDIDALLRCLGPDDAVVLLQDGVIAALADTDMANRLLNASVLLYVLKNDADARGLTAQISDNIPLIDYNQFVQLTVQYPKQLAW